MTHLKSETLKAFVAGEAVDLDEFQAHVGTCTACAEALEREARFEEALHVVAAQMPESGVRASSVSAGSRKTWMMFASAAAAATAIALWASRDAGIARAPHTIEAPQIASTAVAPVEPNAGLPTCERGKLHGHCVRIARQRGLAVFSESAGFVVPTYERTGAWPAATYQ